MLNRIFGSGAYIRETKQGYEVKTGSGLLGRLVQLLDPHVITSKTVAKVDAQIHKILTTSKSDGESLTRLESLRTSLFKLSYIEARKTGAPIYSPELRSMLAKIIVIGRGLLGGEASLLREAVQKVKGGETSTQIEEFLRKELLGEETEEQVEEQIKRTIELNISNISLSKSSAKNVLKNAETSFEKALKRYNKVKGTGSEEEAAAKWGLRKTNEELTEARVNLERFMRERKSTPENVDERAKKEAEEIVSGEKSGVKTLSQEAISQGIETSIKESLNKLGAKIRKLMLNRQDCGKLFMKIKEERTRLCKQFPNLAPQISEMVSKRLLGELEPEFSEYIDRSIFDLKEGGPEKFKQINQNVNLLFNHIYNSTPLADRTGLEAKYHEFTEAYKSRF